MLQAKLQSILRPMVLQTKLGLLQHLFVLQIPVQLPQPKLLHLQPAKL